MDLLVGSCEETGERLSDRMEGELRGFRRLRVAMHLWRCEGCSALLRSLTRTVDEVRELGRIDYVAPSAGSVSDEVVERIRRESS